MSRALGRGFVLAPGKHPEMTEAARLGGSRKEAGTMMDKASRSRPPLSLAIEAS
jgi:hypothetical protein